MITTIEFHTVSCIAHISVAKSAFDLSILLFFVSFCGSDLHYRFFPVGRQSPIFGANTIKIQKILLILRTTVFFFLDDNNLDII